MKPMEQHWRIRPMLQRCHKVAQELEDQDLEAAEWNKHAHFVWCGGRTSLMLADVDVFWFTRSSCNKMGVSIDGGTPNSSISIGFSHINHPVIGVPPWPWKPADVFPVVQIFQWNGETWTGSSGLRVGWRRRTLRFAGGLLDRNLAKYLP